MHRLRVRLNKGNKKVLGAIVTLFVAVLIGIFCINGNRLFGADEVLYNVDDYGYVGSYVMDDSIFFRTDRMIYNENDYMMGMLVNLSPHAIEVKSWQPLIYVFFAHGWRPSIGNMYTMQAYGRAYEEEWIQSGSVLPVDMSSVEAKTLLESGQWKMLGQQYFYEGGEYVVYSNEFVTNKSSKASRFRVPPSGATDALTVRVDVVEPYVVSLTNNCPETLVFVSICSNVDPVAGYPHPDYSSHTTLQRQSGEGTWQVLQPNKTYCSTVSDPISIEPGDTARLPVGDGYPDLNMLESGVYRWHLVTYVSFPDCNPWPCSYLNGAYLFTETFEP